MNSYFRDKKDKIRSYLKDLLAEKAGGFSRVNAFGKDACDRLYEFAIQGKMIRGGLVSLGFSLSRNGQYPKAGPQQLIEAGAAMEILQSALLIHDDIMDRDRLRRGFKSIYYQYVDMAGRAGAREPNHLGEALGICAGDLAYFLSFEILARLQISPLIYRQIQDLISRELSYVGIAQMEDLYWSASRYPATEEEVLRMYLYKTARYTFSLPLMVGGLLAEQAGQTLVLLEKIGEHLGTIFQIKDDEIGLFGDQSETGKPSGSDIREGKRTLYYGYLQSRASSEDLARLACLTGNPEIGEEEVWYVRELVVRLGIRDELRIRSAELAGKARSLIARLPGYEPEERAVMLDLLDYSLARTS